MFANLVESVRAEVLEGLTKSKKEKEKESGSSSSSSNGETPSERKERLAKERESFSDDWNEKKAAKAASTEKMQQRFAAQKRHKVLSGALKAIASHAKHAVSSTKTK